LIYWKSNLMGAQKSRKWKGTMRQQTACHASLHANKSSYLLPFDKVNVPFLRSQKCLKIALIALHLCDIIWIYGQILRKDPSQSWQRRFGGRSSAACASIPTVLRRDKWSADALAVTCSLLALLISIEGLLYYCISFLPGLPNCTRNVLQWVQNASARVGLICQLTTSHIFSARFTLVICRSTVSTLSCTVMYAIHDEQSPAYLSELVSTVATQSLRSGLRSVSTMNYTPCCSYKVRRTIDLYHTPEQQRGTLFRTNADL